MHNMHMHTDTLGLHVGTKLFVLAWKL